MADKAPEKGEEGARRVAIYIRVSTTYQIDKDSLPMQRKDLVAYSELILGIPDYEIFEDAGYSGKNTDRPAFQDMMARIRNMEFSHLLVWKIDRISRNLLDFSEMYMELKKLHVVFVSKNEQFDTSTAMGEAMLKIILVFAELERNMTSERVTATMISRASQGRWNGGRIPYGYSYDKDSKAFAICEKEAEVCRLIRDDYLCYHSTKHTSVMLNEKNIKTRAGLEWAPCTVHIILSNPFYIGEYRYNRVKHAETKNPESEWVVIKEHHPAIFTRNEHDRIMAIMEHNRKVQNTSGQNNLRKYIHIFRGLCYCGLCGSRMTVVGARIHSDGYRNSTHICSKKRRNEGCTNPAMNDLIIGEFALNYIRNIIIAKKSSALIPDLSTLQDALLYGDCFSGIERIEPDGLQEMYELLYKAPATSFSLARKDNKKSILNPEIRSLKKELAKQQRALQRLHQLYLYSESSMPQVEFLARKKEIDDRINLINVKLESLLGPSEYLSDKEFIEKASHLLISKELQGTEYIDYKALVQSTSPEILSEYVHSIIERITILNGKIISVSFRNNITNCFIWK